MITGDKQETAENIGKSCNLIHDDSAVVKVVDATSSLDCKNMLETARKVLRSEKKVALVIDSKSLGFLLVDHKDTLIEVSTQCGAVIVCRAEPLQKAQVVSLIKKATNEVCLAIGDGANDVSMLQEAHIGVGLWGQEGTQAARSSDYALRQFRHLARLITVHGRYNMLRTALMIEFSFYKNLAMFIVQFWFAFYCHFSAQTFYDSWVMAGFNTLLVSAPPLSLALFEKDLREDLIFKYPEVYPELKKGIYLTKNSFARWMISAIYHSFIFWFSIYVLPNPLHEDGIEAGLFELSTFVATAAITTIILKAVTVTKYWVWISHFAYWGSILLISILFFFESGLPGFFPEFYHTMQYVMTSASIYFYIPCFIAACLVPDIAADYLQSQFWPQRWQVIREETIHAPKAQYDGGATFIELQLDNDKEISLDHSIQSEKLETIHISGSDSDSTN